MKSRDQKGFTLIEILMVVSLIGILSVIVIPQFIDFGDDARIAVTKKRLIELKQAIIGNPDLVSSGRYTEVGFLGHLGQVPSNLSELAAQGVHPTFDPFNKTGWRGPYINTTEPDWDKDGWGTTFSYDSVARTITSCGPDLSCGNADDIQVSF